MELLGQGNSGQMVGPDVEQDVPGELFNRTFLVLVALDMQRLAKGAGVEEDIRVTLGHCFAVEGGEGEDFFFSGDGRFVVANEKEFVIVWKVGPIEFSVPDEE